jgi:molecular chaperone GrpE
MSKEQKPATNLEPQESALAEIQEATQPSDTTQTQMGEEGTPAAPTTQAGPVAVDAVEQLKAKAAKADEYWERLLRQAAEFENFKKRSARDRQEAVKFANESLLEKLVSVLDHFDAALAAAEKAQNANLDSFKTGINLIYGQLRSVVTEAGLEEIDAVNQAFDPKWHEAVSQVATAEVPEGQVVQQLRKGYKLRDRLLRPATVVVAHNPAS